MIDLSDPLNWYIEVCRVCGCQLGPGVGSRTNTGRCVIPEHRPAGGIVVQVVAREHQDDPMTASIFERNPEFPRGKK